MQNKFIYEAVYCWILNYNLCMLMKNWSVRLISIFFKKCFDNHYLKSVPNYEQLSVSKKASTFTLFNGLTKIAKLDLFQESLSMIGYHGLLKIFYFTSFISWIIN